MECSDWSILTGGAAVVVKILVPATGQYPLSGPRMQTLGDPGLVGMVQSDMVHPVVVRGH